MELVKRSSEYAIFKKRSGRFGVRNNEGKWLNADKKVEILLAEGLVKVAAPKKKEEVAQEVSEEAAE